MSVKPPAYRYRGTVLDVHDGDTLTLSVDLGFDLAVRTVVRLAGCNAIELAAPGGRDARDHLAALLPVGSATVVTTIRPDKFGGRYDASITLPDGSDLVSVLVRDGWVAAWNGVGLKPAPVWPRQVSR